MTDNTAFTLQPYMHIHLVGIGGAGISAIARVLLGYGCVVSGSDRQLNEQTAALQTGGATIYEGHMAEQIMGADALVISSAIPDDNPEVVAARSTGIPVLKRAQFLGYLMKDTVGIAIAGTHGKTTTTGMVAQVLIAADLEPTVIVGGVLPSMGTNGRYGRGDYFVVEADEYDHMFLGLRPTLAVITNMEHDHPDVFPTVEAYENAFQQFVALLPPDGRLIACVDDTGNGHLLQKLDPANVITYGIAENNADGRPANYQALDCRSNQLGGTDFLVQHDGKTVGLARLRIPGAHNVQNALAAIVVGLELGVDFNLIRTALAEFSGINRRFQLIGEVGGVTIIDDYAHHPTEIQMTLKAARQRYPGRRLWAVWQPHTYSRTRLLLDKFATSFIDADRVVALDIYRSRETDTLDMDTAVVLNAMSHPHAVHIPGRNAAATYVLDRIRPDDVILTLGAGNGNMVGQWILEGLKKRMIGEGNKEIGD
jgi:UDP-N-acetylmuramate--alanine ligase